MILASILLAATPLFVTPEMTYRRGLTDEQYKLLWSMGRTPQVDQATARDWAFKSSRYSNVTNWLGIVGATNDFAKLSLTLQEENFVLDATNKFLIATNGVLTTTCRSLWNGYTNQIAQTISYSNAYVIASMMADAAQAKVEGEIADLQQKITKYEEYKTKYPLLKTVWQALIDDAQRRIEILRSVIQ